MKYFHIFMKKIHPTYTCTICVLNAKHSCTKHTNPWKHDFHMISITKSWDGKFVMNLGVFHRLHGLFPWLTELFPKVPKLFHRFHEHFSWYPRGFFSSLGFNFLHWLGLSFLHFLQKDNNAFILLHLSSLCIHV
jgi:hypothetical protein